MNRCRDALILTEANVNNSEIIMRRKQLLSNENYWHKIMVQNCAGMTRDFILKIILDNVHPLDFIPVCYTKCYQHSSFLIRDCAMAIEKLCQQKLIVQNPKKLNQSFKLMIILAFSNTSKLVVNVHENIAKILTKKYNTNTKSLNLNSFHKDPDLTEFCILSQPKILNFVLHLSKQFEIQCLKLTNNDIYMLSSIESIREMKSLTSLNLRCNRIENISELDILKTMEITELYLEGNPLCDLYDEYTYVQAVKEVCPKIEILDGVSLRQKGFLTFCRNFLCNHDGYELVNQFLEHFFTFYDSPYRTHLITLYDENAMFSLTCRDLVGQVSTSTFNLDIYKAIQRNIKVMPDLSRNQKYLMRGPKNICNLFTKLPTTQHDPYNFTVDLVYYSEVRAIINVTGVFRETKESFLDPQNFLGFGRTFVLLKVDNNEFKIVNEQLHVSHATTSQQQKSFKMVKLNFWQILKPTSDAENNEMTNSFKLLTNLNLEWSKKFLEDCDYDFRKSLMLFVDLYKDDKIPGGAFGPASDTFSKDLLVDTRITALPDTVVAPSSEVDLGPLVPNSPRILTRQQKKNQRRFTLLRTEYGRVRISRRLAIAKGLVCDDNATTEGKIL